MKTPLFYPAVFRILQLLYPVIVSAQRKMEKPGRGVAAVRTSFMMKQVIVVTMLILAVIPKSFGNAWRHIEKTYYLKGAAGDRTIAIKMICFDELPTRYINYFFLDAKKDQQLAGNLKDGIWLFVPEGTDTKPAVALNIAENFNGVWTGTWKDGTGKTWALTLKPIEADATASAYSHLPFVVEQDPYERYRLSNIRFTKEKTEAPAKNILCDWFQEQESGISLFRLRSGNKKINTDSVNLELETIHLSLLQKYFKSTPEILDSKFETTIHYLAPEVLSFRIRAISILQTLKTVQASEPVTLDMKSGRRVKLEDILWFEQANPKPAPDELYKVFKYRKSTFAPRVYQLLQELYPDNMKTDSCNFNQPDSWAFPVWNLTSKGIAFRFDTADGCPVPDWAIIPYKKLTPFLADSYSLKEIK